MPVEVTRHGAVARVALQHGPVNAMDTALCVELAEAVGELSVDDDARAIVVTGNGRVFSAGVDLRAIVAGDSHHTETFLRALAHCFLVLFQTPKPTVAAVDGHAIAGGAVLAACCDHAVAADADLKIGLSELAVGVAFPTSAIEIVRQRTGASLREAVLHARTYPPAEAVRLGFVDEVVAPDRVLAAAHEVAERLAGVPAVTYALTKQQINEPANAAIRECAPRWERAATHIWQEGEGRAALERFVATNLRR